MLISDWSSDVCSSDLHHDFGKRLWCGRCGRQPGPAGRKQVRRRLNETATLPREILSHSNTLIKRIRSLRDKKHRREERSEERRDGKEGASTCRSRWSAYH